MLQVENSVPLPFCTPLHFTMGHSLCSCLAKHHLHCGMNVSFLCRDNSTGKGLSILRILGKLNKFLSQDKFAVGEFTFERKRNLWQSFWTCPDGGATPSVIPYPFLFLLDGFWWHRLSLVENPLHKWGEKWAYFQAKIKLGLHCMEMMGLWEKRNETKPRKFIHSEVAGRLVQVS